MNSKSYDKKIFRLLAILNKLDKRGRVSINDLADEFNVSVRSIQRDLKLLFEVGFPLTKEPEVGSYRFMEGFNIGKSRLTEEEWALVLSFKDVAKRIGPPFDGLMNSVVQKNLSPPGICDWLYFKTEEPALVPHMEGLLSAVIEAIKNKEVLSFLYTVHSDYEVEVKPFRIAQFGGIWYLVGEDTSDDLVKKYAFDRIKKPKLTGKRFTSIPSDLNKALDESFNVWFGQKRGKKVLIEVSQDVSEYFRRKNWFPSQKIMEEKQNGNLLVSYLVSNNMEILPFLKSWIPHVWVIQPKQLKNMLWKELRQAIERFNED